MFKVIKYGKNSLECNELVVKAMLKRRKLASCAIAQITDIKTAIKVVK